MQMNTVRSMDVAKAAMLFGSFEPPPRLPAHPRLDHLQKYVLKGIRLIQELLAALDGEPELVLGPDGLQVVNRDSWTRTLALSEENYRTMGSPRWRQFLRDVERHLPGIGRRYRSLFEECERKHRDFLLMMSLMVGTDFAAREGVDLSTPFPEDVGDGPSVTLDL
jgi:hypothetical protein